MPSATEKHPMSETIINPKILSWARHRSSISIEELARAMKEDPGVIEAWESGAKSPSYAALEELAYKHLNLPLAVFYFPEPPKIDEVQNKFRRLPASELARLSPDTFEKIWLGMSYQESLREIGPTGQDFSLHRELIGRRPSVVSVATKVRSALGVSIAQQFGFGSSGTAFKAWRFSLEKRGIFSFKDSFHDKFISGFCLLDDQYPIIFINNSNAFSRQVFTLIHELGHILIGVHGVTDVDERFLEDMSEVDRNLEVWCNAFAAEFLVPSQSFRNDAALYQQDGESAIQQIAKKYSVSREVILRRLLDLGLVSSEYYEQKSREWNRDYLRTRKSPGGNYYLTKISYLGEGYTRSAFLRYKQGRFDQIELANHLNMNSRNLSRLESNLW